MQGKLAYPLLLFLLLVSTIVFAHRIQPVKSDYVWTETIYIQADGSIQPPTAPISSIDNVTYTLTDNIAGNVTASSNAIIIQRNNIIVDGAGHMLQGTKASGSTGIELPAGRSNVTIKNVKITAFHYGIWLYSSSNNIVSGNNITANNWAGVYLHSSSNNNSVSGNSFVNDDLFVYGSYGNAVTGNLVNGKPLVYLEEVSDYAVGDAGQVILVKCNNITVQNLNLSNTTIGVELWETNKTTISGNNITAINYVGIYLYESFNNRVSRNNMTNNEYCIYLGSSSNNSVSGNSITANSWYGIYLYSSSNNTIYHNNMNNTSQVYSSGSTNVWDNGYPSGGNYWSDYSGTDEKSGPSQTLPGYDGIGDVPYIIAANNTDGYPLMQPLTGLGVLEVQTPTGTNVTVSPTANVSITFANVTAQGFTSWNTVQPPTDQFVSVTCNELRTSANYTGNVTVKFAYDPSGLSLQDQQAMKIWLWNDSSSCWVDITTSVNTTSHIVYGVSTHLSVFGITRDLGLTGDLGVQGTTTVSIPSAPPPPPPNLSILNYYQINTTKSLGAPINLSLAYNPINIQPGQEVFTQMWLWNESSTSWVDITSSVNTTTHTVYGISPHLSVFGITNLQSAPTGISVTSVNSPKTVVCQGYNATIGFTITNQGDNTQQNFNILLYCNATLLATFPITRLDPNSHIALSINWSTTTWVKGNYSINTCSSSIGWIKLTIVGDVNGDGKVNLIDVFAVALAYGSEPGYPKWNPNYDINNDAKINLIDYFTVCLNYGKTDT